VHRPHAQATEWPSYCATLAAASSGRRLHLRLAERWAWAADVTAAVTSLQALPPG
jgi:hypothetical protein